MWRALYAIGMRASRWLNRVTTDPDSGMSFSAKSHDLAIHGRWWGYLRCVVIDALWFAWERAHCRKSWEYWTQKGVT